MAARSQSEITAGGRASAATWPRPRPLVDDRRQEEDRASTLAIGFVRGVLLSLDRSGLRLAELLRAAGIDAARLEDVEARMSRTEAYRLFALAVDVSGDPALGLHLAESSTGEAFGAIAHLVAHALNLRHAFQSLCRFQSLLRDDCHLELVECDDEVTARCERLAGLSPRMRRFSSETVMTNCFRLVRYFDPHATVRRVCFEHAAPRYRREYTRIFAGAERFQQPFTGIVFDRALLDFPSPHTDPDLHEALRTLAERRALRLEREAPYALRVREVLTRCATPRRTDMATVARTLGLSVRSLRRRLADEGTSYGAIEHDALAIVARRLLRDERRTIQEAAFEMGFSETTAFHRAFKRWTGTTPRALLDHRGLHGARRDA